MGNPAKYITYLLITAASVGTLIYYLFNTQVWDLYGYNLGFLVLVASIPYAAYMFINEIIKSDGPIIMGVEGVQIDAGQVVEKSFMQDVYFKYLYSFSYAVLLFYIINLFRTNFKEFDMYPTNWYYVVDIYVNLVLPVFCLCDVMITPRYRHHHYLADMFILFLITFMHCAYKVLIRSVYYEQYKIVFPTIADYIMIYLISLNGYTLYDFMLYKRINPQGDYAIFSQA